MLTIVLTRHGHTLRSDPEQYLGQRIDVELDAAGRAAASALGGRLSGVSFDRVLASPLRRALETARICRSKDPVEPDERLLEADYGDWEGRTIEEIDARWPEVRHAWETDPADVAFPGGEAAIDVAARSRAFIGSLLDWEHGLAAAAIDHRVLVVAHSTLNRVLLADQLRIPLPDYRRRLRQDWANLTVLRYTHDDPTGPMLLLANDLSHLRGIQGVTWGQELHAEAVR
jgi:broad specificity phosphatase PhoE